MTESELKQLFYLSRETERLIKDLQDMEQRDGYKSPVITGMPRGTTSKDVSDYIAEKIDLQRIIELNLERIRIEHGRLERYISNIEDAEIRLIFRLRHINGMTWEDIGDEINMDRRTVSRKYYKYLKSCPQCP